MSEKPGKYAQLVSYVFIRRVIGLLGLTLPIVLILNSKLYCQQELERSISHYYYSNLGSVFVGVLTALAMFFFSYKGYEKEKDNLLTNIAGFGALGVAFFPTDGFSSLCLHCGNSISDKIPHTLHFISAIVFFISLAILLFFYFTKSHPDRMTREKKIRNAIYRICGVIMLVCLGVIAYLVIYGTKASIFWPESIALFVFGFAWIVKGELILGDK